MNPAGTTIDTSDFEGIFATVFAMADEQVWSSCEHAAPSHAVVREFVCVRVCSFPSPQVDKLLSGKMQSCTSFFKRCVVLHGSCFPLVVSLVATSDANIGMLAQSLTKLNAALEPVRKKAETESWVG